MRDHKLRNCVSNRMKFSAYVYKMNALGKTFLPQNLEFLLES